MAIPEGFLSQLWVALTAVVAPGLCGCGLVRALGLPPGAGVRLTLGLGYVAGQFVVAVLTAVWLWLGQPVPGVVLPLVAATVGVVCLLRTRRRLSAAALPLPEREARSLLVLLVTGALLLLLAHEALVANGSPVRFGDEAQIWAGKAKALYAAPVIPLQLGLAVVEHADYPNLGPLAQVLAFASVGRVLHFESRLPLQAFGLAVVLLLSAATSRRAHPAVATMILVAAAATLPTGAWTTAGADVALACALLATVECLLRWFETGQVAWWRCGAMALAAMLATKNEGAMLALAVAGAAGARWWLLRRFAQSPHLRWRELGWLLVPAAAVTLHAAFNRSLGLRNDLLDPALAGGRGLFARMLDQASTHGPQVLSFFARLAIDPAAHRLLPLLLLAAVAAAMVRDGRAFWRGAAAMLLAVVAAGLAGYLLVFTGTHADLAWHLATAGARTAWQVVPVAALGCAIAIAPRARANAATRAQ